MSLAYSPQAAQQLSSSTSMSITSVHIRLVLIMSGEENSIGEPGKQKTKHKKEVAYLRVHVVNARKQRVCVYANLEI